MVFTEEPALVSDTEFFCFSLPGTFAVWGWEPLDNNLKKSTKTFQIMWKFMRKKYNKACMLEDTGQIFFP